jgi:hypothetical protein
MGTRFLEYSKSAVAAIATVGLLAGTANAIVLTAKSEEQKLRQDINKQQIKYVQCLAKAAIKCESTGARSTRNATSRTGQRPARTEGDVRLRHRQVRQQG